MKVLFIIYGHLDQTSGGYLYDRRVISSLRQSGDRVEVAGLRRLPFPLSMLQSLSPRLRRRIRRGTRDCVVIDELVHPAVFLALPRPGSARPPVITLVHHLRCSESAGTIRKTLSRLMEKRVLSRSRSVVVNSRTTAETVCELLGRQPPLYICPPGRDALLPGSGRDEETTRVTPEEPVHPSHGALEGPVHLLTVGNLIPRKGHLTLLAALALVADLDWRCTVAGGGGGRAYEKALHRRVDELGLQARVIFTGRITDERLRELYRRANLFLFPSEYEGYGIALAEAVSQGVPYIATDRGAARELVNMGTGLRAGARQQGGYLVPGGNAEALARVLRGLLEDRGSISELSGEALQLSRSLPVWADTGACFRRALAETAGEGAS